MRHEEGASRFAGQPGKDLFITADLVGGVQQGLGRRTRAEDLCARELWNVARQRVRAEIGPRPFAHWIAPLTFVAEIEDEVVLAAPTELERDRARSEFGQILQSAWSDVDPEGRTLQVRHIAELPPGIVSAPTGRDARMDEFEPDPAAEAAVSDDAETGSEAEEPMKLFDSFIVGESNRVAHGLMKRIAHGGGVAAATVMLVGPHGVGKSLLLRGVEQALRLAKGEAHVIYMSAEDFMLAFVDGVKRKDTSALRRMVRNARVILLDDFQFICSRPGTLQEFFSHMRAVAGSGGVVVLASDQPPAAFPQLDRRMRDELQGGAYAEIGLPELELRRRIVRASADEITSCDPEFRFPDDFADLLAERLPSTGRALYGAVRNVYVGTTVAEKPITQAAVEKAIQLQLGSPGAKRPRIEVIKDIVSHCYGLTKADMESSCRKHSIAHPRQYAMYFCRKLTPSSYPAIGKKFGDRDHTTVLYSYRKVSKRVGSDRHFFQEMLDLEHRILSDPRNGQ